MSRRKLTALASAALLAPLLTGAAGGPAGATEVTTTTSGSPLRVIAPKQLSAPSYDGRVYLESVATLLAQNEPFEVRAHRTAYSRPITGEWLRSSGAVPLPENSMETLAGLDGFAALVIRDKAGTVVKRKPLAGCLSGSTQRLRPDAPAHSPYPVGCPWNPYALGSVMGIQEGWGTPLGGTDYRPLKLSPGTYRMIVAIKPAWRDYFGILPRDARAVTTLTVSKAVESDWRRPVRPGHALRAAAAEPTSESAGSTGPRPDLRSLPAFDISLNRKGTHLRFAANVWNAGDSPLVVDGYREPDEDHMDAYQYFFDSAGNQVGYQSVGEMHFHAANHNHWHFEDFARYRLLDADKKPVARSRKQSFCLAATDAIDYTVPGADWHPENTDLSTACGGPEALAVREALQSGSGDTYMQYRAGQAIRVEGLPNGTYYLAVEANPFGHLIEQSTTNNVSYRKIRLAGTPTNRRVRVPRVGLIEEVIQYWW